MKRALCVGINYTGTSNALMGCSADVLQMSEHLNKSGFAVTVLCDDDENGQFAPPTRENIMRELRNIADHAIRGECDTVVFHYSGHGGSTRDVSGLKNVIVL